MTNDSSAPPRFDGTWRRLSEEGNRASEGDPARARRAYEGAIVEAERLLAAAEDPDSEPDLVDAAPVLVLIACQNAAELERRRGAPAAASRLVARAFERVVTTAVSPRAPRALRQSCADNLKHVLEAVIEDLPAGDADGLRPFVERAMAAWLAVRFSADEPAGALAALASGSSRAEPRATPAARKAS
ncbi:MAG: hypothetical protein KF782_13335 [Labilithrix sp.]|nr:hypothetical protein [Labilithrix sp.]